jgi:hypothetical protein
MKIRKTQIRYLILSVYFAGLSLACFACKLSPISSPPILPAGPLSTPTTLPSETPTVTSTPDPSLPCAHPITFGNDLVGTNLWNSAVFFTTHNPANIYASKFELSEPGHTNKIEIELGVATPTAASFEVKAAIYSDTAGSPANLIVSTDAVTLSYVPTSSSYVFSPLVLDFPPTVLSAGTYWITLEGRGDGWAPYGFSNAFLCDRGSAGDGFQAPQAYGAFPTTFPAGTSNDQRLRARVSLCGVIAMP